MKRNIWAVVILGICFLLQTTLLAQFNIGGTIPNLLIVVVASLGFLQGRRFGMTSGFICGLMIDIFFGQIIGTYALLYMIAGYSNGYFRRVLFHNDIKMPLLLIAATDFTYGHICYIIFFLLKGRFDYLFYLGNVIMPELIYTEVMACLIYPIIHFIYTKIEEKEKAKEHSLA